MTKKSYQNMITLASLIHYYRLHNEISISKNSKLTYKKPKPKELVQAILAKPCLAGSIRNEYFITRWYKNA